MARGRQICGLKCTIAVVGGIPAVAGALSYAAGKLGGNSNVNPVVKSVPSFVKEQTQMHRSNGGYGNSKPDFSGDNSRGVPFLGKLNDPVDINPENLGR